MKTFPIQYVLVLILSTIFVYSYGQSANLASTFSKQVIAEDLLAYVDVPSKPYQDNKKYKVNPPQFVGGRQAMFQFVEQHITYPETAWAYGLEGSVIVQVHITSSGNVTDPTIIKGLGLGCDQAVLDLVEQMPDWKPALENGHPVASTIQIPMAFSIDY